MNAAYQWLVLHPGAVAGLTGLAYHILSAFIGSLEMPDTTSGKFYRFFFRFTNMLAANYFRAQASTGTAGMQPPKQDGPGLTGH